jgi:hypothetical protein
MKNMAIDILGHEERKNVNKELFGEEFTQLLEQKNKAYRAYLAICISAKERNVRREGSGLTQRVGGGKTGCQSTIAIEEEFKESNPRQACRMVQKIKCGYTPHTDLCKDTKWNIIGEK